MGLLGAYLDLTLPTSNDHNVRIVERPAFALSDTERRQLVEDMKAVARTSVQNGELDYGVFDASGERLRHSVITVVYDADSRPIAFNALALMDVSFQGSTQTVVHLGLVLVDPSSRSKGLSWILYGLTCVLLFIRNQMRTTWISNVTQVPAVIGMVSDTFDNVYPNPNGGDGKSFSHVQLAREIMEHHRYVFGVGDDAGFDEDRFIITNAYTGGSDNLKKTFEQVTKHRNEIYNTLCNSSLNYGRGDDFLQIGQINTQVVIGFLIKDVPRNAIFQVLFWFLLMMINGMIVPLIQWFSSDRQMGILRPNTGAKADPRSRPIDAIRKEIP